MKVLYLKKFNIIFSNKYLNVRHKYSGKLFTKAFKTLTQWIHKVIFILNYLGWIVSNNQNGNLTSICNGFSLFGGFNLFGNTTIVSKHFSLPTHYQLKITFEFWKIDSWDNEFVYIFVDDALWKKHYYWNEGIQLCGDQRTIASWYEVKEPITITMNHTSESLIFIMTTNLDEYADGESFGFRDFQLSIVRCPQGCLYCSDSDQSTCNYWVGVLSLWHESILLDGWMKNDIIQPATYRCESFDLVGGQLNLAPGDYVKKNIENLSPHYKIQVNLQLWKIDSWINENFYLFVDNSVVAQAVLGSGGAYSICGSNGLEQIYNIGVTLSHSSSKFQLTMTTSKVSGTTNSYWGIRALNIYLSKCYNSCNLCVGPYRTDCTVCSGGLVLYKSLCTNCIHKSYYKPLFFFYQKFQLIKYKIQSQMKGFLWRLIYQKLTKKQRPKEHSRIQLIIVYKY